MQIILVSRHLKQARTVTIMPWHVLVCGLAVMTAILLGSVTLSWLSVHLRLPIVEGWLLSIQEEAVQKHQDGIDSRLQSMAHRLGELQAHVLQLDIKEERVAQLSGGAVKSAVQGAPLGQGGPYVPEKLSAEELQHEMDRLAKELDYRAADLSFIEARLFEKRAFERALPTTLPVKEAALGSVFGYRSDPITGSRSMHEGLDFSAESGTPVVAAADGMVLAASYHPEYGNVVDLEHGDGLSSRYAHLSRVDVKPGQLVKRGALLGAVGSTGRSTGSHLHFEVRMQGVAQNPASFLKRGNEFAMIAKR